MLLCCLSLAAAEANPPKKANVTENTNASLGGRVQTKNYVTQSSPSYFLNVVSTLEHVFWLVCNESDQCL